MGQQGRSTILTDIVHAATESLTYAPSGGGQGAPLSRALAAANNQEHRAFKALVAALQPEPAHLANSGIHHLSLP